MGGLLLLARLIKLSLALEQSEPQSVPRKEAWALLWWHSAPCCSLPLSSARSLNCQRVAC